MLKRPESMVTAVVKSRTTGTDDGLAGVTASDIDRPVSRGRARVPCKLHSPPSPPTVALAFQHRLPV